MCNLQRTLFSKAVPDHGRSVVCPHHSPVMLHKLRIDFVLTKKEKKKRCDWDVEQQNPAVQPELDRPQLSAGLGRGFRPIFTSLAGTWARPCLLDVSIKLQGSLDRKTFLMWAVIICHLPFSHTYVKSSLITLKKRKEKQMDSIRALAKNYDKLSGGRTKLGTTF